MTDDVKTILATLPAPPDAQIEAAEPLVASRSVVTWYTQKKYFKYDKRKRLVYGRFNVSLRSACVGAPDYFVPEESVLEIIYPGRCANGEEVVGLHIQ